MMRTVVCGELSDSMYKAQELMKTALATAREEFRPGLTVSDADKMMRNIIRDNDVGAKLITRSGYSIGIAFPPSWDEGYIMSLFQGHSDILRPGMTFHVIPWMWGIDGDKSCGISDTFYITEDGCGSFFEDVERDFTVKADTSADSKVSDLKPALKKQNMEKQSMEKEKQKESSGKAEKG
jgi:Xaa-Pro dipeptidase